MLAKKYRLTKHGSFNYVYRHGERHNRYPISLVYVKGGKGVKVGFSVPNKVGKAVYRNKVKRRLRAAAAVYLGSLCPSQLVFSATEQAKTLTYAQIENAVGKLLSKAGLLQCESGKRI